MTTPSIQEVVERLRKALQADELTAGPWQVIEEKIPHRLGGYHVERRIFATWDHPQLKGPLGVVNHSIGVGAEEGAPACHLVQIDAADAAFIAAANPTAILALLTAHEEAMKDAERYRALKHAPTELITGLITAAPGHWDDIADRAALAANKEQP